MILYLLQSSSALLIIISLYQLLLKRKSFLRFNRYFLLLGLALSLILPAFQFELREATPYWSTSFQEVTHVSEWIQSTSRELQLGAKKEPLLQLSDYLLLIYLLGLGFFFFRFFFNLYKLLSLTSNKGPMIHGMQSIIVAHKTSPFSFFAYLFINREQAETISKYPSILAHEYAHYRQKHSLDVLLIELVHCLFWFHPLILLFKKAIKTNHEFLADEYASKTKPNEHDYLKDLLDFVDNKTPYFLGSSFSYRSIKKRIQMIHQSKPSIMNKTSKITASILLATSGLLLTAFTPKKVEEKVVINIPHFNQGEAPSILPISEENITKIASHFGMRKNPINKGRKMHTGVDIIAPKGTAILATADGIIESTNYSEGYGKHIKIKHGDQYQSMYAHLNDIQVKAGQKVRKGEVIGIIGSTGKSLAVHLHYEVIKNGEKVNPSTYFPYEIKEKK
jgi:murein DD-endopeptidase MepM/ murein hydrolase activator NlpD